jgi:hypothetical protein
MTQESRRLEEARKLAVAMASRVIMNRGRLRVRRPTPASTRRSQTARAALGTKFLDKCSQVAGARLNLETRNLGNQSLAHSVR